MENKIEINQPLLLEKSNYFIPFLSISLAMFFILFGLAKYSWADCTGLSPNWFSTADYASVNSCVSAASAGDTITVTGDATWPNTLTITRGVNLRGSDMVGVNPRTPVSGTLFKFTAPNTWTAYYTPFTYPHPLRGLIDTIPPAAPKGLEVQ